MTKSFIPALNDLWENQFIITQNNNIKHLVKSKLLIHFQTQWHTQLQQTNKGQIYKSFKQTPSFENYWIKLTKSEYTYLFKFRTANHWLPVETGRYDGTPFDERTYTLCNSGQVGSEHHYLLNCAVFNPEREQLFGHELHEANLNTFLSSDFIHILKNTCQFICFILNKFKTSL